MMTRPKPLPLEDINLEALIQQTEEYMDAVEDDEVEDTDLDHYIFEKVMMAIYGRKVWDWVHIDRSNEESEDEEEE